MNPSFEIVRPFMELVSDFKICCDNCGKIHVFSKDYLEVEVSVIDERGMGSEIEYDFSGSLECDGYVDEDEDDNREENEEREEKNLISCANEMSVTIRAYEYPEGIVNDISYEADGCSFVTKPKVSIG